MPGKIFDDDFIRELKLLPAFVSRFRGSKREGLKVSKDRGGRVEFKDFRSFSEGDDFRSIDWNVYARTEQLFVKEFTKDERLPVYILVDNSRSMDFGTPSKAVLARRAACMFAYMALAAKGEVSVALFDGGTLRDFPPVTGAERIYEVMRFLENTPVREETDIARAVTAFLDKTKGRGVVLLVSDFLDERDFYGALARLRERFKDLTLVFVSEKLAGGLRGALQLFASETGEAMDAVVTEADASRYLVLEAALVKKLHDFAVTHKTSFIAASNTDPPIGIVV